MVVSGIFDFRICNAQCESELNDGLGQARGGSVLEIGDVNVEEEKIKLIIVSAQLPPSKDGNSYRIILKSEMQRGVPPVDWNSHLPEKLKAIKSLNTLSTYFSSLRSQYENTC